MPGMRVEVDPALLPSDVARGDPVLLGDAGAARQRHGERGGGPADQLAPPEPRREPEPGQGQRGQTSAAMETGGVVGEWHGRVTSAHGLARDRAR